MEMDDLTSRAAKPSLDLKPSAVGRVQRVKRDPSAERLCMACAPALNASTKRPSNCAERDDYVAWRYRSDHD